MTIHTGSFVKKKTSGGAIGLYRENVFAIEIEDNHLVLMCTRPYVTLQITFHIPEFAHKERNLHRNVVQITTKLVSSLVLNNAIAAIQTSR